jgi:hypothetical protein
MSTAEAAHRNILADSRTNQRMSCPTHQPIPASAEMLAPHLASHRSRIAPYPTLDAPRIARIAPFAALLRPCAAPVAACSAGFAWPGLRIAPPRPPAFRAAHGGLRVQHFKLAPRTPALPVSGLLRLPRLSAARLLADCSAPLLLTLFPARRLLRARFLAFRAGLRIAPYAHPFRPSAAYGLLRAQHLKLSPARGLLRARHLAAEFRLRIAPLPSLCALLHLRIAPRLPL